MPGIAKSRSRQLVSLTTSDARNASADENARAAKPSSRSKSGSDSRTDSSSSTTDTSERLAVMSASVWRMRHFASGVAEIFDGPLIQVVQLALRSTAPHECRDRLDKETTLALAFAQFFIGSGELADALRDAFLEFVGDA